jgi:class 3 adenylate cyclase
VVAGITQQAPPGQEVRVRVLGQLAITAGDRSAGPWPRPSARRLFALLLVSPGHRLSRDLACEELFPRLAPRAAARSLSKALSMARAALAELGEPGSALLGADLTHLWLAPGVAVDADDLATALHAGLAMPPGQARDDALAAALAGDAEPLPDEPYADWADRARDRLSSLCQEARLALARDRAKGAGRSGPEDVAAAWLACLDHDQACEEAAAALIRAHLAEGRPEQAARVFERCRAALERLGLRISPSLERIYAPAVAAHAPQPVTASNPPLPASPEPGPGQAVRPPREERRPVTVLFAEVVASAGLAGTLGLEALRDLVGGSLAAVIAEVEALGGTVSSVSGRGLQAIFGAPQAHEDDPERALRAAFRALSAAAASTGSASQASASEGSAAQGSAAQGRTAALRIGVESGPAVVGPIGGGAAVEYAAFGDVVSVAAALQSAARPGSVLVGPATRRATAHLFSWGADEEATLVPGAKPLAASYLDAPLARTGERRPPLGGRARLIGRQDELRVLDAALRRAVAGRGGVIMLTGEPGLGKTRLVQESRGRFIGWVGAGGGRRPLWLEGRGASYASATPYGLFRTLIAGWIGVALDQPSARIRAALGDALIHLLGNTNLLVPLAHLMGLPGAEPETRDRIGPEELRRQAFGAVRALVTRFAAMGPTVLVLEDLHWADPTSLRLIAELADLTANRRLLLLATSRTTVDLTARASGPGPAADVAPPLREVRLSRLGPAAAQALATSLIGQVGTPEVLATILASAEGNPLFLEERLAEMLDAGTLIRQRGRWWLREPADPPLPQVLERLVRSRVDRLSPAAAEAIRAAAVIGVEFTADALARTLGTTPAALRPALDEMRASDLVHPEPHESTGPVYRFRHALIQEATYLALLRAERRDLHARAAQALETAASGRLPEVAAILGRHYATAENADRALHYLELAGDHATRAFANDEAIASFREATAVAEAAPGRPADAVRLYAKLANVQWRTVRWAEARAAFQSALRLAGSGPGPLDPVLRAHLLTRLGRLELSELRYAEAARNFEAAEALLGDLSHADDTADDTVVDQWLELMVDGRADLHMMRFEHERALAVLERARPLLEARGGPARKSAFYRLWASQHVLSNRLRVDDEDLAGMRASIAAAEHTGEDKDVGYATNFLGWALWMHGDLSEAAQEYTKALVLAERIGEMHLRDVGLLYLARIALRRHDTETLRTLLPQWYAAASGPGRRLGSRAAGLAMEAWLAWQDGRPDEVFRLAAEIETYDLTTHISGAMYRWVYLFPLIAARLRAGELEAAVTAARRIIDRSQQALPDDLTTALAEACESWDRAGQAEERGGQAETTERLTQALALATASAYF